MVTAMRTWEVLLEDRRADYETRRRNKTSGKKITIPKALIHIKRKRRLFWLVLYGQMSTRRARGGTHLKELPKIGENVIAILPEGQRDILFYDGLQLRKTLGLLYTLNDGGSAKLEYNQNFATVVAWMSILELPKSYNK